MNLNLYKELDILYQQRCVDASSVYSSELLALSNFVFQQSKKNPVSFLNQPGNLADQLQLVSTESELKALLRNHRNQTLCNLIQNEFSSTPDTLAVMTACSELADECITAALNWLMQKLTADFGKPLSESGEEQALVVIAMGKLGGKELNLSSDIDLIFAFPEPGMTQGGKKSIENEVFFHRLVQRLINVLSEVTQDGFVFRVDTRLRPFGDSGPLVLSFGALAHYYLEQGRDWERFAMVKARAVTGSSEQKKQLEKILIPFVYRRYIDFSMLESPRQMKLQIEIELRRRNLKNNLKLGSGGIREIEFIVQALQLIHGGKRVELQTSSTLVGLKQIKSLALLPMKQCEQIVQAYLKLRHWEHCLQGIADRQTQELPETELDRERLCFIDNKATWLEWLAELEQYRTFVHQIFSEQFQDEGRVQRISFHSELTDLWRLPDQCTANIKILEKLGYEESEKILEKLGIFKKRIESRSKPISQRASNKLQRLIPEIIKLCGQQENSLEAFDRISLLIEEILTRTAYLELFVENRATLELLVYLFSQSPWIAQHARKYPLVLDDLLNPQWQKQPQTIAERQQQLIQSLARVAEDDDEQLLGILREFKQSQHFQLATGFISEQLSVKRLAKNLSAIAEVIVNQALKMARVQVERRFGKLLNEQGDDADFAIIAMGKLGSRELGFSSDLDLIFIHDGCTSESLGKKSVEANQFFVKLAQKLIHILSTRMSSGVLYEIDTRLRPMGNSGLLVTSLDDFSSYQLEQAWTWEHQALIRARPISGSKMFQGKFEKIRREVLLQKREPEALIENIKAMRVKMQQHFGQVKDWHWNIKHGSGGITDIEFLIQYLVLCHVKQYPLILEKTSMMGILKTLAQLKIIPEKDARTLTDVYQFYREQINKRSLQQKSTTVGDIWHSQRKQVEIILEKYHLYPWVI